MSSPATPTHAPKLAITNLYRLPLMLVLLAALSSVLTTVWLANSRWSIFSGVLFGVAITCGLAIFKAVPGPVSAVALIFASVFAHYVAFLASFGTQFALAGLGLLTQSENWNMGSGGSASPISLLVGGLVGGFLLGVAFPFAVMSQSKGRGKLRRALLWSAGGGGLAILGWALGPLLGQILSPLVHAIRPGEAWLTADFRIPGGTIGTISSVYFVWQTGMALAIGTTASPKRSVRSHGERS